MDAPASVLWLLSDRPPTDDWTSIDPKRGRQHGALPHRHAGMNPSRWNASRAASVVLIEDHPELAAYLAGRLAEHAEVAVFSEAESARAHISAHGCTVLISDIGLAGMSGIELCRRLKSDPEFAAIPIILISALSSDANRRAADQAGAAAFLAKPFSFEALLDSLDRVCT